MGPHPHTARPIKPPHSVPSPRAPCSRGAAFCGAAPSQHCYVHSPIPTHANMDSTPCTCGMWGAGCRVQNVGCRMGHAGRRMQDRACRMGHAGQGMQDGGCRTGDAGWGMQDRGCRTGDARCREQSVLAAGKGAAQRLQHEGCTAHRAKNALSLLFLLQQHCCVGSRCSGHIAAVPVSPQTAGHRARQHSPRP